MSEIAVFHPDAARRLLANSREFEAEQSLMDDQNRPVARPVYLVKVTGAADPANGGFYPCVRVDRNFDANTWEDDTISAWLDSRSSTIELNKEVVAILAGVYAKDKTTEAKSYYVTAAVGSGTPCTPGYTLLSFVSQMNCDTFGSNLIVPFPFQLSHNGCGPPFQVQASGKVSDSGGAGVAGVPIISSNSNPNAAPNYVTIATTASDGTWSGVGFIIIDATSPTPSWYTSFKATGYLPSEQKYYLNTGPITNVNFAP